MVEAEEDRETEVTVIVFAQDCSPDLARGTSPEELRKIAQAFEKAALALEKKLHGVVEILDEDGEIVVSVGIDQGGDYDPAVGLPLIT